MSIVRFYWFSSDRVGIFLSTVGEKAVDKYAQPVAKTTVVHRLRPLQTKNNSTIHEETVEKISPSERNVGAGAHDGPSEMLRIRRKCGKNQNILPLVRRGRRPLQRKKVEKFHNP